MHGLDVERMVDVHDNEFVISNPGTGAELQQGLARPVLFIAFFLKVTTLILISVRVIRSSPDQRPYDHYCKCISRGCHTHSSASTIYHWISYYRLLCWSWWHWFDRRTRPGKKFSSFQLRS